MDYGVYGWLFFSLGFKTQLFEVSLYREQLAKTHTFTAGFSGLAFKGFPVHLVTHAQFTLGHMNADNALGFMVMAFSRHTAS